MSLNASVPPLSVASPLTAMVALLSSSRVPLVISRSPFTLTPNRVTLPVEAMRTLGTPMGLPDEASTTSRAPSNSSVASPVIEAPADCRPPVRDVTPAMVWVMPAPPASQDALASPRVTSPAMSRAASVSSAAPSGSVRLPLRVAAEVTVLVPAVIDRWWKAGAVPPTVVAPAPSRRVVPAAGAQVTSLAQSPPTRHSESALVVPDEAPVMVRSPSTSRVSTPAKLVAHCTVPPDSRALPSTRKVALSLMVKVPPLTVRSPETRAVLAVRVPPLTMRLGMPLLPVVTEPVPVSTTLPVPVMLAPEALATKLPVTVRVWAPRARAVPERSVNEPLTLTSWVRLRVPPPLAARLAKVVTAVPPSVPVPTSSTAWPPAAKLPSFTKLPCTSRLKPPPRVSEAPPWMVRSRVSGSTVYTAGKTAADERITASVAASGTPLSQLPGSFQMGLPLPPVHWVSWAETGPAASRKAVTSVSTQRCE